MKVINGGIQTLTEDWPGRVGYLRKGIPQSGPADHFAHRAANLIVGNPIGEVSLEITGGLFEAEFTEDIVVSITGADMKATVNGQPVPMWKSIKVSKGDRIKFGPVREFGWVSYLGIAGGIDIPLFYGSKATCATQKYGGFKGRKLQKGDELELGKPQRRLSDLENRKFRRDLIPEYLTVWQVRAMPGPQAAPDYFTEEGMDMWFNHPYQIDHNADRGGYRLRHPKPLFSRKLGSSTGGTHPSNITQQPYPPGALNVAGDFAIILFVDGVSEGGFVCPLVVIRSDLWKVGQARLLTNFIEFVYCTLEEARESRIKQNAIFTEESLE